MFQYSFMDTEILILYNFMKYHCSLIHLHTPFKNSNAILTKADCKLALAHGAVEEG